jgi:GT2 family glycosyltransferase
MMKIAVITALWYEDKYLPALFASLKSVNYSRDDWEIVMIDNKNSAATREWFAKNVFPEVGRSLPKVKLIAAEKNLGFAGGNNAGIEYAKTINAAAVYLLNEDTRVEQEFLITAASRLAENDKIGAVQSLLVLDPKERGVNSIGNCFHYLGFSYCGGYKMSLPDALGYLRVRRLADPDLKIATASGAGVLLRMSVLEKVGLLDENYHLYHEDLDLSLRIIESGFMLVVEPLSVVYHGYEFGRSAQKYYFMERNRYRLLLEHYKLPTLIILFPAFVLSELGLVAFGLLNGSLVSRLKAYVYILDPRHWAEIGQKRKNVQSLRVISDKLLLGNVVTGINFQETTMPAMRILNWGMGLYWRVVRAAIFW